MEVTESVRLDRVKSMWESQDPRELYGFSDEGLTVLNQTEKVWLYGNKRGLDIGPTEFPPQYGLYKEME